MVKTDERSFGDVLRRYRLAVLLTQEQLAERAHLSYRTISDLERGAKHTPRRDTVLLLADALALAPQERATLIAAAHPVEQKPETSEPTVDGVSSPASVCVFLIADLRGYTSFTEVHGDEAAARLTTRFAALCDANMEQHQGQVIESRGDEVLAIFSSARQALRAAVTLVAQFKATIGQEFSLQVGVGLDAGDAVPVQGGYRTGALNLAARLQRLARNEVFASETVVALARKTEGLAMVSRGAMPLKGLAAPVLVFQIAHEGELREELPPLEPVRHPTNLGDDPTSFIGRERESSQIMGLVNDPHIRLVTLTGPGGTGKTRLAQHAGGALLQDFAAGVFFVSLASLVDPALVPSAIAGALSVKEEGGKALMETIGEHLREQRLLLVLDNLEHLLEARTAIASLLDACGDLHVLATSRIPLHLSREHEYAVPPLSVPDLADLPPADQLARYESVALFIERARAVQPGFRVTADNASAIAAICTRLDGLPLAIELAAARIKLFPPQALLRRLSSRFEILTGGSKDVPRRQQTLRATIDWSYDLLDEAEQTLFSRLSVFIGGCTFEAAEVVCNAGNDSSLDVENGIASLVEKNLLRQTGEDESRFVMLATVRDYAVQRFAQSGDSATVTEAYVGYFLSLATEAAVGITGPEQLTWLRVLNTEIDNLRGVLASCIEDRHAEHALQLAAALGWHWWLNNNFEEALVHLQEALALGDDCDSPERADALRWAGNFALDLSEDATRYLDQGLAISRRLGDSGRISAALNGLGTAALVCGDYGRAQQLYEESLHLARLSSDNLAVSGPLVNLALVAFEVGDLDRAITLAEESVQYGKRIGESISVGISLHTLGMIAYLRDQPSQAIYQFRDSLRHLLKVGDRVNLTLTIWALAAASALAGDDTRTATLMGVVRQFTAIWHVDFYDERTRTARFDYAISQARTRMGSDRWNAATAEGALMSAEEATAYALGEDNHPEV